MKKKKLAFIAAALCLLILFAADTMVIAATDTTKQDILTVTGQGKVKVIPDMAYVTVDINTEAKTANATQAQNNQTKEKVVLALKSLGIRAEEILTINYSISPKFSYVTNSQGRNVYVASYKAVSKLQVTVSDVNSVGNVLDAVVSAGGNLSGAITFGVSKAKMSKAYDDALTEAINDAVRKAQLFAKSLNVSFGEPIEITEGSNNGNETETLKNGKDSAARGEFDVTASVDFCYEY